jgi:DNA-binding NarL/FixJ family response regulator
LPTFRCLVADDHPAIIDAVSRFLEGEDEVELVGQARDGERALRDIEKLKPDVAVLDIRMPGLGGIEIARRLTAAGSPTAVILYTGHPEQSLLLEGLDAGARGFLLKEAPLDDLMRAIRIVAGGGTYVDAALTGILAGPEAAEPDQERAADPAPAGRRDAQRAGRPGAVDLAAHRAHARAPGDEEARGRHPHAGRRARAARLAHQLAVLQNGYPGGWKRPMV